MAKMNRLFEAMKRWARPWPTGTSPIEIRRALLDEVETRIVSAGGGKRVFPFNRLRVRLLAPGEKEQIELEAVVREVWDLQEEVRERLTERGCTVPADLRVTVNVIEQPVEIGEKRYAIDFERTAPPPSMPSPTQPAASPVSSASPEITVAQPPPSGGRPTLELTVLKGTASRKVYSFPAGRLFLGRLEEILDEEGRVRRRNDVAFLEEGDVNQTVSREHARILFDEATGDLRLRAEPGASGTRIFREGRSIEVSGRDPRGVRLQSGDEVYLGRACLKVLVRPEG